MTTLTSREAAQVAPAAPAGGVWVLAADDDVLVRFDDWQIVRGLYRFVDELQSASQAARRLSDCRVLGASVEVDSPAVRAWRVGEVGALRLVATAMECGLGDGVLLSAAEAEAARPGDEDALETAILRVSDDGMLLVVDEDGREATIDLTALVAAGRGR